MELLIFLALVSLVVVAYRKRRTKQNTQPHQRPKSAVDMSASSSRSRYRGPSTNEKPRLNALAVESQTEVISGRAYVVDGDTLTISKTQVRLFGVDAPEMNHPYGQKAKWAMVAMCKGHIVSAELTGEDEYGRTVAKCTLSDGRDLSAEMVKQGLALDWPTFSGGAYASLEPDGVRKKLWLADARQKGRLHVWETYEARQAERRNKS